MKDQDNDFNENRLITIKTITINNSSTSDNERRNKKYVDGNFGNGPPEKKSKVTVSDSVYHLEINNKEQNIETTFIKIQNTGGYLLQHRTVK